MDPKGFQPHICIKKSVTLISRAMCSRKTVRHRQWARKICRHAGSRLRRHPRLTAAHRQRTRRWPLRPRTPRPPRTPSPCRQRSAAGRTPPCQETTPISPTTDTTRWVCLYLFESRRTTRNVYGRKVVTDIVS